MSVESAQDLPGNPKANEAFFYSNYRRFFIGNSLSNVGTWFQNIAQALLVIKLTHRASALGEVLAVQTLPLMLFGPFVGPFIDRAKLRKVLVIVSSVAGLEAFGLAALVMTHHVTVNRILLLAVVLGFSQIFTQPAIQTLVSELVPQNAIASAASLNAVQQATGRLLGPAAAGLIYAWRGPATCFVVNGVSYIVVLFVVLTLRSDRLYPRPQRSRSARQFLDGISYVWHSPRHRGQLLASFAIGIVSMNFPLFYSSFTQLVLHSGSASFGIAEAINGACAVSFGIVLSRRLRHPTRRTYVLVCLLLGCALLNTSLAPNLVVFYVDMGVFGAIIAAYYAVNQSLLQLNTPRDQVGSVMTLLTYTYQGTTPLGSFLMGWVIGVASTRVALQLGASVALVSGVILYIGSRRRPSPTGVDAA